MFTAPPEVSKQSVYLVDNIETRLDYPPDRGPS